MVEQHPPALELRNASKEFLLRSGEKITAVSNASLAVQRGEFVCAVGPSGHGKSTILNLFAGFASPSSGNVVADGKEIVGPSPDRGVVFQRDTLFNWMSIEENVAFGLKARGLPKDLIKSRVDSLLDTMGLEKFRAAWPKQLSGGMRRRAAIAAVFANEPSVLLMDEPFTGLDYARRAVIHTLLLALWHRAGNTVFCVTHDLDEALALATKIVVVVRGKIVEEIAVTEPYPRDAATLSGPRLNEVRLRVLGLLDHALASAEAD